VLAVGAKEPPFSFAVVGVRGCGSGCSDRLRRGRGCVALVKKRWGGQRTVVVERRDLRQGCNAAEGRVSE
jgi:hypothetical protein